MLKMTRQQKIEYIKIQKEINKRKSRANVLDFTLYTKDDYQVNWHHELYAQKLDDFVHGKIKNLMVAMPPQHGKSELSTRRVPALMLGRNPELKIGLAGYNSGVASRFNKDIQRIMDSKEYGVLFPQVGLGRTKLNQDSTSWIRNSSEFEIVGHAGSLVSVGVGGSLTSRRLDVGIIDDVYKDAQSAWSKTVRDNVLDWYDAVFKTRLHNDSQQLFVMTRWHEEDLAGEILKRYGDEWELVCFPAIKEDDNNPDDPREIGEALWESRHSRVTLEKIRATNPVVFDSLYQQNPTPKEGLVFVKDELKRFRLSQIDLKPDTKIAVCDTADEGTDSLCFLVGFIYGKDIYIVDVIFTQDPIEVTQPLVASMIDRYNIPRSVFESNNGGKGYAQKVRELKRSAGSIKWDRTSQNKHTKILMNSGIVKDNVYFLVDEEQSPEYKKYFYELCHYPRTGKAEHDDAPDGTTMLVENVLGGSGGRFLKVR